MSDANLPQGGKITSELLNRAYAQLEGARDRYDQIWLSLMVADGLSIGLVFRLGGAIAQYLFHDPKYGHVVTFVMPFVNFYLFFRFGAISYDFTSAKFSARELTRRYLEENGLAEVKTLSGKPIPIETFDSTASYFDSFYSPDVAKSRIVFAYGFLIPVVLAVSHATSLILFWQFPNGLGTVLQSPPSQNVGWLLCALYLVLVTICYIALLLGLKKVSDRLQPGWVKFIFFVDIVSPILTAILLYSYFHQLLPQDVQIPPMPAPGNECSSALICPLRSSNGLPLSR